MPDLLPSPVAGSGHAIQQDAIEVAGQLTTDIAYLDPPDTEQDYLASYHLWETLVRWDNPAVCGKPQTRVDYRERRSAFCEKITRETLLEGVIHRAARAPLVIVTRRESPEPDKKICEILRAYGNYYVVKGSPPAAQKLRRPRHPEAVTSGDHSRVRSASNIYILATAGSDKHQWARTRLAELVRKDSSDGRWSRLVGYRAWLA
jgi:hypothetical protein